MAPAARSRSTRGRPAGPAADQRILELLLLLLDAPEPLSRARIFDAISGYRTKRPAAGERKFERDKKDLRELGVPLEQPDPETHTYRIDRRGYALPPVALDDEERSALLLAAEAVRGAEGLVYGELTEEALRKLSFERSAGGPGGRPAHVAVGVPTRRGQRGQRKRLAELVRAAETRKRVRLTYLSESGEPTERAVDPYAVVSRGGDWVLVGFCHLRAGERTFRVDRIRAVRVAARPGRPDFERPVGWSAEGLLRRSPWVFRAGGTESVEVVLEVGPERAWMAEEEFGDDARRDPLPGGWVRVRFRSGNPEYVVTRVLDGGGHLRLIQPARLRERVLRVCQEALGRYGQEGGGR